MKIYGHFCQFVFNIKTTQTTSTTYNGQTAVLEPWTRFRAFEPWTWNCGSAAFCGQTLNLEFSKQRAPRMLASIWPSRDENHGQDGHNLELWTCSSAAFCGQPTQSVRLWTLNLEPWTLNRRLCRLLCPYFLSTCWYTHVRSPFGIRNCTTNLTI